MGIGVSEDRSLGVGVHFFYPDTPIPRYSDTPSLLVLREQFFGVFHAGRRHLAAEQTGEFVDALRRFQARDRGEGAGIDDAFGDVVVRVGARRDLREMADAEDLVMTA